MPQASGLQLGPGEGKARASMFAESLSVATILCLLVAFAEWLSRRRVFRYLGSALIVILAAAVLANAGLIPSSRNSPALYDAIFNYIAPLSIFFLLLDVKLRDLRRAGLPMLLLFSLGALATMLGVWMSYRWIAPQDHGVEKAFAVAGMFTGTYIGGSVNLNAVALQYGVGKNGTLFAAINAADNIITTVWIIATLILPRVLQRFWPRQIPMEAQDSAVELEVPERTSVLEFSILLALGLGSLFVSQTISRLLPALPYILTLTTIALLLAQLPAVQRLGGARVLGYFTVLIFLAVIGAYCDLAALIANGTVAGTLLLWVTAIVFLHAVILFGIGGILRQDWALISVASNANIGGATSAGVLAVAIGRSDLRLPGILAGSLGNAIGTYAGFLLARLLM
jgi:uncharacterized membrane protein